MKDASVEAEVEMGSKNTTRTERKDHTAVKKLRRKPKLIFDSLITEDTLNSAKKVRFDSEEDSSDSDAIPSLLTGNLLSKSSKRVIKKGKETLAKQENFNFNLDYLHSNVREILNPYNPFSLKTLNRKELNKFDSSKKSQREVKSLSVLADGSKYIGEFLPKTTIKDGIGCLINSDGSIFEGSFRNDLPYKGRYILISGKILEGRVKNFP
ncbi:unnamed protein product [Moneuplotes crassus]|uniref:Uncharacterized protein n=1 Tax=Euplotes crassus TaxID=5936 RepID=A0AAD1XID5_EUPCR|nr:unnamed protein product [Moneuplotes crassus]